MASHVNRFFVLYSIFDRCSKMSEVEVSTVPPKIDSLASLGPYIASHDNSENLVYFNNIPDICKDEPCLLGVDEAGRGPVLGPMVYGIAFCPISKPEILKDLGCADSKTLTEEKRETIFDKMSKDETSTSLVGWAVDIISPNFICNSMFRRSKSSLNEVSMNSAISLIKQAAEKGVNIAEVYVDTVGPPEKYQAKLSAIFPDYKITVAKKADSTYPIVSAASIAAKVSRDHALKVWKFQEGLELKQDHFGSGYPGDPVTKKFLRENIDPVFGYPQLVRFSWSTAETALQGNAYNVSWDDEEEDTKKKGAAGMKRISSFFAANGEAQNSGKKKKTHQFFTERHLQIGSTF